MLSGGHANSLCEARRIMSEYKEPENQQGHWNNNLQMSTITVKQPLLGHTGGKIRYTV